MLSAMQVRRALDKGDQVFVVQLSELKSDLELPANQKLADLLRSTRTFSSWNYLVGYLLSGTSDTPFLWNRVLLLRFDRRIG
jgi:hypothetical protein